MFCPQCRAEYRPGFTRCSDCEVDLVEYLPASYDSATDPSKAQMRRAWLCDERESCVSVCSRLRAAGIPFRVTQSKHQFLLHVDEHYEIWVPDELYDNAKTIAEEGCLDFSDDRVDQDIMELPDAGPALVEQEGGNWNWCPQDANVEVWSEKTEEEHRFERVNGKAWMVELSLRENGISTQVNVSEDGFRRLFVRSEDEFQAREIVRQIVDGTPPR
jgi:hypothetical protein